jgi:hypothetical protein
MPTPATAPTGTASGVKPATPQGPAPVGSGTPSAGGAPIPGTSSGTSFGKAGAKIGEGAGKAYRVGQNSTAQQVGMAGASMLASKALAGDTSPNAPPPPPSSYDTGDAAASAEERERRRRMGQGRASTVLTSPLGISKPASVGAKVLLGA